MEERVGNEQFEYHYSSEKQKEIESIRKKYEFADSQDNTLDQMKKLDREVEKAASKQPIVLGSIGTALLGLGMCATMVLQVRALFVIGIFIGVIGIALMALAYPLYAKNIQIERKKAAPEMLKLAEGKER